MMLKNVVVCEIGETKHAKVGNIWNISNNYGG